MWLDASIDSSLETSSHIHENSNDSNARSADMVAGEKNHCHRKVSGLIRALRRCSSRNDDPIRRKNMFSSSRDMY